MPWEIKCGQCQGMFAVDEPGLVVDCPHCRTRVEVPQDLSDVPELPSPEGVSENVALTEEIPAYTPSGSSVFGDDPEPTPGSSVHPGEGTLSRPFDTAVVPAPDLALGDAEGGLLDDDLEPDAAGGAFIGGAPEAADVPVAQPIPASFGAATGPTVEELPPPVPVEAVADVPEGERIASALGPATFTDKEPTAPADPIVGNPFAAFSDAPPGAAPAGDFGAPPATTDAFTPTSNFTSTSAGTATPHAFGQAPPAGAGTTPTWTRETEPSAVGRGDGGAAAGASSPDLHFAPAPLVTTGVSRSLFMMVVSYASAVTLAAVLLLYVLITRQAHTLESLPDVKPTGGKGGVTLTLAKPEANVAPNHTLRLGESRRFGNVRVTPLRVTRGPLSFAYSGEDQSLNRENSDPVLKLWLRFENVSADQTFAPLDPYIAFSRKNIPGKPQLGSNNFVCRADDRTVDGDIVALYDLDPAGEISIKGLTLEQSLAPGQSTETWLPTQDYGLSDLTGELVWRVQFRKGYNPQSKRGVTTLIDVSFPASAIQPDPA